MANSIIGYYAGDKHRTGISKKTGKPWESHEFYVDNSTDPRYESKVKFTIGANDRHQIENLTRNQQIEVLFHTEGRVVGDRPDRYVINELRAYKVLLITKQASGVAVAMPSTPATAAASAIPPAAAFGESFRTGEEAEDLPF
jgi:hypothetical protein